MSFAKLLCVAYFWNTIKYLKMWHQVKLQYYIYYFKNLLLELLKITQEGGVKNFWDGNMGGGGQFLKGIKYGGHFPLR